MTKKTATQTLIGVVVIAVIFVLYLVFFTGGNNADVDLSNPEQSLGLLPETNTARPTNTPIVNDPTPDTPPRVNNQLIPTLRQISDIPVAGFTTFDIAATTTETTIVVEATATTTAETAEFEVEISETVYRFVDKSNAHVFETSASDLEMERITNTTIPKISTANFFNNGEGVILRYLDSDLQIETFVANIVREDVIIGTTTATSTVTGELEEINITEESEFSMLEGSFLDTNISNLVKAPNSDDFFYTRGRLGYVFDANTPTELTQIINSPITEWLVNWTSNNILLTTKPSGSYEGISFEVSTREGELREVLDDKNGLVSVLNSDGTRILFSENINNEVVLGTYNTETNVESTLSIHTFADKCVWSQNEPLLFYCAVPQNLNRGNYPDLWYQGRASFNDSIYRVDLDTNSARKLEGLSGEFDIIDLQLSPKDDYLTFINKKDLTLWSLDIKE